MNPTETRDKILHAIASVAPDADVATLDPNEDLREELDIDSMDFLNILVRIEKDLGVSVPEKDYGEVGTLAGLVRYVASAGESGS
jgi:acyl carrier protein